MQGVSDLNADFRVKDESDGTMCLESVTCPNTFVSIGQQIKLNVNLLVCIIMLAWLSGRIILYPV